MREDGKPVPIFEFSGTTKGNLEAVVEFTKANMEPHVRQQFEQMISDAVKDPENFVAYALIRLSEMAQTINNIGYALQINGIIDLGDKGRTEQ